MNYEAITPKNKKMEKIDQNKLAQIDEEANIIYEDIRQAIPENSRAISVAIAMAQALKNTVRQIDGSINEVKIREIILAVLDLLKANEDISNVLQKKQQNKKEIKQAASVLREIKAEVKEGVIKSSEIPSLCNIDTGQETGFAVILTLSTKFDYDNARLENWRRRLDADDYWISVSRNQLKVRFNVMF